MLKKEIENKLGEYRDRYLEKDLFSVKAVKEIKIQDEQIFIDITLGYPYETVKAQMASTIKALLAPLIDPKFVHLNLSSSIEAHVGRQGIQGLPHIKNIIVVASGKGGVGKSTLAVNVALALQKEGALVGLLDADFYGPSQPTLLGAPDEKPILRDKKLDPIERYGIKAMSIGFLVDHQAAVVWRGPMIGKAMQQLLYDTNWGSLDYLVVDLPPGTGDIQITLCQKIPVSGALMITTPQDVALLDVRRACEMFNKLNVPILGVVENMSQFNCQKCGHSEAIFGEGGAKKLAEQYGFSVLGELALDTRMREMADQGVPMVQEDPMSHNAFVFHAIAKRLAARLSLQAKDYSFKFPKIVVQHDQGESI